MEDRSDARLTTRAPRRARRRLGFSLIELLVVVTAVVILVVLSAYAIVAIQEQSRITQCASNLRQVRMVVTNYSLVQSNWYPLWGWPTTGDQIGLGSTGRWRDSLTGVEISSAPAGFTASLAGVMAQNESFTVRNWRVFYCPNLAPSSWMKDMAPSWTNPTSWLNWPYSSPNIGYTYFNGNSPIDGRKGYINTVSSAPPWWEYVNQYYRGKPVYDYNNNQTLFAPGSGTASFAAGWMTDPPDWILLADRARYDSTSKKWMTGTTSNYLLVPDVNHEVGMNTVYNDGSVRWAKYGAEAATPANWHSVNYNGVTVAGAK